MKADGESSEDCNEEKRSANLNGCLTGVGREEPDLGKRKGEDRKANRGLFAWTRTVELERVCVRVVVPTDFKAAFEADSLENIVDPGGLGRERTWETGCRPKSQSRLDPEWSA